MAEDAPTLTPRMKHTMWRAAELARARGHDYLGTEHVILALIEDPNGIAGLVMKQIGCTVRVRDEVIRIMESDGYSRHGPPPNESASGGAPER